MTNLTIIFRSGTVQKITIDKELAQALMLAHQEALSATVGKDCGNLSFSFNVQDVAGMFALEVVGDE